MPIRPQALRLTCPPCGWTMVYAPPANAVFDLPPSACKKCGHKHLNAAKATDLERTIAEMVAGVGAFFGRKGRGASWRSDLHR